ncbi:Gfo/Idh/MocA family protein [Herbiconiux sp. P17]|uniref:Gfo/Idh/MocA family protein n=1 Tax=Herbiconiux wuyangfengii TaxID=3342794 RepID=UPI0035B97B3E
MPWWRDADYFASRPWRGTWAGDGGGSLMNQGIHFADLMIAVLGRPEKVAGFTGALGHDGIETEDTAGAVIRFSGGAIATLLTSTAASPGSAGELRVHGTGGSAMMVDERLEFAGLAGALPAAGWPGSRDTGTGTGTREGTAARSAMPTGANRALARQYADVVDAVRSRRPPRVGLPEARAALALVKAAYIADVTAATVSFDAVLSGALDHLDPAGS